MFSGWATSWYIILLEKIPMGPGDYCSKYHHVLLSVKEWHYGSVMPSYWHRSAFSGEVFRMSFLLLVEDSMVLNKMWTRKMKSLLSSYGKAWSSTWNTPLFIAYYKSRGDTSFLLAGRTIIRNKAKTYPGFGSSFYTCF